MQFKEIFREFLDHSSHLKVIFVGSCNKENKPNVAPKMLVHMIEPNEVFYIDYKFTQSYANIQENKKASLSFMNDRIFTGYRLNGECEIIHSKEELELLREIWKQKVVSYEAERMIDRVKGKYSTHESENLLPDNFVVVKFKASEASVVKPDRVLRAME